MTIRDWVTGKLASRYAIELIGEHGLQIQRHMLPTALVYCSETSGVDWFTIDDLNAAYRDMPGVQFIVLVKQDADNEAYEQAEKLGVCLSGFSELKSALEKDFDISSHLSDEQRYVRQRLEMNRYVSSIRRRGESAYELSRTGTLPTLNIVTITRYELTSDSIYELLEKNDTIDIDAIVCTNPNCRGFAPEALAAGDQTGARVLTLKEFLSILGDRWT